MKIYRVHYRNETGESVGYKFFDTAANARHEVRTEGFAISKVDEPRDYRSAYVQAIEIDMPPVLKYEDAEECVDAVLAALNKYASHPDNG